MVLKYAFQLSQRMSFYQFRKISHQRSFSVLSQNYSQEIKFDDVRIQKHLNFIKGLTLNDLKSGSSLLQGFSYDAIKYTQDIMMEMETVKTEINDLDSLISDLKGKEKDLLNEANSLKNELDIKARELQDKVLQLIIPVDIVDKNDIIMELTAGVGGQEAMLFTKDMFQMYCNYANFKGWNYEIIRYDDIGLGGIRSGHISINGSDVFKLLKFESGVHRVQRVPKTEKAGRIHTSTMTVAILPQPSEIEIIINPTDLEVELKRSSGAGGQHVNTTDSCVRIKHKPTGIVTESQMQRNQHQNRALAMKALRAKLYERQLDAMVKETKSSRKLQIGSAGRSEKIRTYNFVQDRITDHRAHLTVHGIEALLEGGAEFEDLSHRLQEWCGLQMLLDILNRYDEK